MKYVVMAEWNDAEVSVKTNDIELVFMEMVRNKECDHLCVCDGETGEVLMHTGDEPYCTTEFGLMMAGYSALQEQMLAEICEDEDTDCEVKAMPGFVPTLDELDCVPGELAELLAVLSAIKEGLPS